MDTRNKVALGLLGGVLLGVAAGMVFAPKPGKETREALRERAEQLRRRIKSDENEVEDPAEHYIKLLG